MFEFIIYLSIFTVADTKILESPVFLKSVLSLLLLANQKQCDYMNSLLGLIKTVIEKGALV